MGINSPLNRKLRMGLVGGGQGSFIGRVHSIAACLDNRAELVAGALSSDPERAKASAPDYDIAADRAYVSYQELITAEAERDDGVDFISIATPNHTHFEIALAAVQAGLNVVCDKPLTLNLEQALELERAVLASDVVFAVTHNYTGYPLVRQARQMVADGELGDIQAIRAGYIQGWLRTRLEEDGQKQAEWRTNPAKSGAAGCFGDIATHAFNLARFIADFKPTELSAHLRTFESGRQLDDYGTAVIKFDNGGLGTVTASQISHGRENDLYIEIDGTLSSLSWRQENPNEMIVRKNGEPHRIYTRDPNAPYMNSAGAAACRLPSGHPEAFFEAFANVYASAFDDIVKRLSGESINQTETVYPNIRDGVEGMLFIEQCVASSQQNGSWLPLQR